MERETGIALNPVILGAFLTMAFEPSELLQQALATELLVGIRRRVKCCKTCTFCNKEEGAYSR